jgi:hypothetical protein
MVAGRRQGHRMTRNVGWGRCSVPERAVPDLNPIIEIHRTDLKELIEAAERSPWHGRSAKFDDTMKVAYEALGETRIGY